MKDKILKNMALLTSIAILMVAVFSFNIFADNENDIKIDTEAKTKESQEIEKVYQVRNPKNYSQMIVDKNGKILVKSIDSDHEYLMVIEDRYSKQDIFLSKTITGESLEREAVDEEKGIYYQFPSHRTIIYDLKGNILLETSEKTTDTYYTAWNGKLLYKGMDTLYIYDFEKNERKESELIGFPIFCNERIMLYNAEWDEGVKRLEIYDKDMNLLKTLENTAFEYDNEINKKQYHKVQIFVNEDEKVKETKEIKETATDSQVNNVEDNYNDKRYYNYIDDDGNFYFDHYVENEVYNVDTDIIDFYYDDMYFTYDMANRKYVIEPTKMTPEKRKEIDDKYNKRSDRDNDPNVQKLEEMTKEDNSYVDRYEKDGKVIYMATYGGHMINEDTGNPQYVEYHNLYNANLELIEEKNENISMSLSEYGYIIIGNAIYDFDMNKIKETDGYVNFHTVKISDKIFFVDMYDEKYQKKERMSLYDEKFDEKLNNKKDIMIFYDFPYIFATDDVSTKMYDIDFNLKKDLAKKYDVNPWYNSNHLVLVDKETGRYSIATNEGEMEIKNLKEVTDLRDDYFTYLNGFKYGIMDYKGNVIVSFSIFNTLKEDADPKDYFSNDIIIE